MTARPSPGEIKIRAARRVDVDAIADAYVASWRAAYVDQVPQTYLDRLDPADRISAIAGRISEPFPTAVLVAVNDGYIIGHAVVVPSRDDDAAPGIVGEITAIYVRPEAWGRGAGRKLMTHALDHMRRAGFAQATLWVLDSNDRAIRFYQRSGWRHDATTMSRTIGGQPVTVVRFRRTLTG